MWSYHNKSKTANRSIFKDQKGHLWGRYPFEKLFSFVDWSLNFFLIWHMTMIGIIGEAQNGVVCDDGLTKKAPTIAQMYSIESGDFKIWWNVLTFDKASVRLSTETSRSKSEFTCNWALLSAGWWSRHYLVFKN